MKADLVQLIINFLVKKMSNSNSHVELFEVTVVNNEKIIFKLHRLGYITCLCGKIEQNHECLLINDVKELKIKFELCSESACRFCEPTVQWHYERYMQKEGDDKVYCRKCEKEISGGLGVCHDCFCKQCYSALSECNCCKFCIGAQCVCNDDTVSNSD